MKKHEYHPFTLCIFLTSISLKSASNLVSGHSLVLNKCEDFEVIDLQNTTSINAFLPPHLMSNGKAQIFRFVNTEINLRCKTISTTLDLILTQGTENKQFSINNTNTTKPISIKPPVKISKGEKLRGKIFDHFTPKGEFQYESRYYNPSEFCISKISNTSIEVRMCQWNCEAQNSLPCIPKCCGLGETLIYWNNTCVTTTSNKVWKPSLYSSPHKKMSNMKGSVPSTDIQTHTFRPHLHCSFFERWPLKNVRRPKLGKKQNDPKTIWRILENGNVVFLAQDRTWKPIPKGEYCIDGFANWGIAGNGIYTGDEKDQVLLLCPEEIDSSQAIRSTIPYFYSGVLFFSSIFLLLTALIHILLFEKQHIHGLTVLSHSVSMFSMYIFLGLAYFTSARTIDGSLGQPERSLSCATIGILAHFFFLSTFSWLTIMNFDLWWTFRTVQPVSRISKRMTRFAIYSLLAWGAPIVGVSSFVALDIKYSNIEDEVLVPDYGVKSCFVACYARGAYIYYILSVLVIVNVIFVGSTCRTFFKFQSTKNMFSSKKSAKTDKYSFKLFGKLFIVMGVAWCFELLIWIQNPCNTSNSWLIIVLDIVMFLQAIANFLIFCCNPRTVGQLEDKFPAFKQAIKPYKKFLGLEKLGNTEAFDLTPASVAARKMSTTSTLSQSMLSDQMS